MILLNCREGKLIRFSLFPSLNIFFIFYEWSRKVNGNQTSLLKILEDVKNESEMMSKLLNDLLLLALRKIDIESRTS